MTPCDTARRCRRTSLDEEEEEGGREERGGGAWRRSEEHEQEEQEEEARRSGFPGRRGVEEGGNVGFGPAPQRYRHHALVVGVVPAAASSRQASRGSGVVEPATVEGETGVCFIAFACERGRRWAVQGESDVQRSRKQTPRRRGVFSCITSVQGCAASRRASGGVFSGDRVEYLLQAPRYNRIA